jgi:hypothetical protein
VSYLAQYLDTQGSSKCPGRLLTKILKAINHLAYPQWKHRNKYVHQDDKPFEQSAIQLLDYQILGAYSRGHPPTKKLDL